MKRNFLIAQSGGPTVAINASLSGILQAAQNHDEIGTIYGAINGIEGVLNQKILSLSALLQTQQLSISKLSHTPAMYLGSCRYRLAKESEAPHIYQQIFEVLQTYQIDTFFYIGGNDSMDTVQKLSDYAKQHALPISIIGIPKTIDNDLVGTDHTPGFGSAAKYIATSMLEIAHDAAIYPISSVTIVEIMGRNAGWLTAASALARNNCSAAPHLIYLPEKPFSKTAFLHDIKMQLEQHQQIIVAVSEGLKDANGTYLTANTSQMDVFGHTALHGVGSYLEHFVQEEIGCKVRSIELNVLQRCAAHIASSTDQAESLALGEHAVSIALENKNGRMVALERISNQPYQVSYTDTDVAAVANMEKQIPTEWIHPNGNDITPALLDYLKPLILGESPIEYKDGIPNYASLPEELY